MQTIVASLICSRPAAAARVAFAVPSQIASDALAPGPQIVTHTGSLTSGHYAAYVRARDAALETERLCCLASGERPTASEMASARAFEEWRALHSPGPSAAAGGVGVVGLWQAAYSWYRLDDNKVTRVRASTVEDQQAYMLLYVRRDCWKQSEDESLALSKMEAVAAGEE